MTSERKAANALSGKTARPCDGCSRRRARWFCVADDAFLCQSCDESVHSANPLASRHERVRLETASFKPRDTSSYSSLSPTWHQGFAKRARTPRRYKSNQRLIKDEEEKIVAVTNTSNPLPLVPEIGKEESDGDEDEFDLIFRVPVFDHFASKLSTDHYMLKPEFELQKEEKRAIVNDIGEHEKYDDLDGLHGFLPSEVDLAEFAADVENLLGKGLDKDYMNDFKMLDCKEEGDNDDDEKFITNVDMKVKDEREMEEVVDCHMDSVFSIGREPFEWNFDDESPVLTREDVGENEEEKKVVAVVDAMANDGQKKRTFLLRLNHEAIMNAWASQGLPWTTGNGPQLNPDDCLPHSMDGYNPYPYGRLIGKNGARDARVLRYKEKRRTRLFSKKIRYQVRKLNAEKRPRMKGRFVKRTSFMSTAG